MKSNLGSRKKCFVLNCAGYGFVFKAWEISHIEIYRTSRNAKDEFIDKQVWLAKESGSLEIRIIDYGRKYVDNETGHIPGAVFIDMGQ